MAGRLKSYERRKERAMWVFDGEEWTRDGEPEQQRKSEPVEIPMDLMDMIQPQLQVVEVVQTTKSIPRIKK